MPKPKNTRTSKKLNPIVTKNGEPVASSLIIAKGFERKHFSITKLLETHRDEFKKFGELIYKSEKMEIGGRRKVYYLNRKQFLFLITLQRNQDIKSFALNHFEAMTVLELLDAFDAHDLSPDLFVYVAKERATGNFKIGISKDPQERVKQINACNSSGVDLVKVYRNKGDGYLSETMAHGILSDHRLHGEWFDSLANIESLDLLESS